MTTTLNSVLRGHTLLVWSPCSSYILNVSSEHCLLVLTGFIKGEIGVLDRTEMDHFADIFLAYQKRGKAKNPEGTCMFSKFLRHHFLNFLFTEIRLLDQKLAPWTGSNGRSKRRAAINSEGFSVK